MSSNINNYVALDSEYELGGPMYPVKKSTNMHYQ